MTIVPDWAGYQTFREQFREAMDERYWPIEWLDERLLAGRAQFMRTENAAIVVEIRAYPGGAVDVHGLIAAGVKDEIINELIPAAEEWGRQRGCTAGVIESRPGWSKAMKSHGYEVSQIAIRKEL